MGYGPRLMVRRAPYGYLWVVDSEIRARILMLVDELLRRGVPEDVVAEVLRWLDVEREGWMPKDLRWRGGEVKRRSRTPGDMGD